MNDLYLVTGTSVLTDDIFVAYGGLTGTSTAGQRNAAYQIAEQFGIEEINTFFEPTILTGTFAWPYGDSRYQLPYNRVRRVLGVTGIYDQGCDCAADALELSGCAWLLDPDNGVVDLRECSTVVSGGVNCGTCGRNRGRPMQFRIAYEAGIPAGTASANAGVLMGLTMAAGLALEQIIDPAGAEGGPGDPSLQSFSDTAYSETRQYLKMTAFGGSPKANYAARMLAPLKYYSALKL